MWWRSRQFAGMRRRIATLMRDGYEFDAAFAIGLSEQRDDAAERVAE